MDRKQIMEGKDEQLTKENKEKPTEYARKEKKITKSRACGFTSGLS